MHDRHRRAESGQHRDGEQHDLPGICREEKGHEGPEVVADPPALSNCGDDRREVVVGEDDVRGLARRLGAREAHRDAHVGATERGRVVDPVAGDRHDLAPGLKALDEVELVRRLDAGEHLRFLCAVRNPDFSRDRLRGDRMVTRDHDHVDPCAVGGLDGSRGGRPDGILEADDPECRQGLLGRLERSRAVREISLGDSEDPQPSPSPFLRKSLEALGLDFVQLAAWEDRLGRALHDQPVGPRRACVQDRDPTPHCVERELGQPLVVHRLLEPRRARGPRNAVSIGSTAVDASAPAASSSC